MRTKSKLNATTPTITCTVNIIDSKTFDMILASIKAEFMEFTHRDSEFLAFNEATNEVFEIEYED